MWWKYSITIITTVHATLPNMFMYQVLEEQPKEKKTVYTYNVLGFNNAMSNRQYKDKIQIKIKAPT